jgi:aminoglycoside phosphotransferase (APT) family kinase protein
VSREGKRAPIPRDAIDEALAGRLISAQFPAWAHLPLRMVIPGGWDNRTFRLGDTMSVRMPAGEGFASQVEREQQWLPRLAPRVPLTIPEPLARGAPGNGYPWAWSIYRWIEGESMVAAPVDDLELLAGDLAHVLDALHRIDPGGGPVPRPHDFIHGGTLRSHDEDVLRAIASLGDRIDAGAIRAVWSEALASTWQGSPVWVHGDLTAGNLLVNDGRLCAIIDWGCTGVGDPACDLVPAWTLLSGPSRQGFRAALPLDTATWARGRGWALWKALVTLDDHIDDDPLQADRARSVIEAVLDDERRHG